MTLFDKLFFSVFKHYKDMKNKKANNIATAYISVLQSALILLLGVFFAGFFNQMNVNTLSQDKAITLFVLACVFIFFKNWMQYAGRKRKVLNAKMLKSKSLGYNIWLIWLLPLVCLGLSFIIYQAV
jgi:DNA integrity scanning protein DisA with diadenylate cyclase activity